LEDSTSDYALPPLLPRSEAPRGRHTVEREATSEHAHTNPVTDAIIDTHSQPSPKGQKTSVPIAGVLNKDVSAPDTVQSISTTTASSLPPFSGRLSDLLIDPSQPHLNKRRRIDEQTVPPTLTGPENNPLTLPKPPQLPKKPTKRPRIPPLLQGLHQPPPLPEGRLFPPITSEGSGFGRNIGERVGLRSPARPSIEKEKDGEHALLPSANQGSIESREGLRGDGVRISRSTSDNENQINTEKVRDSNAIKSKELRKRNKWSEEETKDLLVGVSKFGIGNWKKILECSDFVFNQRTAVDLKDRFRTCCPGEGLKRKKPKEKRNPKSSGPPSRTMGSSVSTGQDVMIQGTHVPAVIATEDFPRNTRGESHRKGPVELAKMGIHGPFVKNKRRERREFTNKDDENLLKGFAKYSSSWHSIRDDKDFGFSGRHPTDLRDRFRIRYPEKFAKAGYKLKPRHELILKEKDNGAADREGSPNDRRNEDIATLNVIKERAAAIQCQSDTILNTAPANTHLGPLALHEPLHNSFPSPLDDFADPASEEDAESSHSPITLNRNIFEWVDANPSSVTSVTMANLPAVTSLTGESHLNFFNGTDGMHINPMATLNLPMALLTSNTPLVTQPPSSTSNTLSHTAVQYSHNVSATTASSTTVAISAPTPKVSMDPLLLTPNLPTIVFPHVPASSARSAVHNLPPPTDLLSGLDVDVRPDAPLAGLLLEDPIVSGYDTNATLAPMMGGTKDQGMLSTERISLEEISTERRR
jgi:hypothetical protein